MSLSIDRAQLIAVILQSFFLGIYFITLFPCFKALLWRDDSFLPRQSIPWTMLIACLLFVTCNILDFSVQVYRVIRAFTVSPERAIAEFSKMSDWTNVVTVMNLECFFLYFNWANTSV